MTSGGKNVQSLNSKIEIVFKSLTWGSNNIQKNLKKEKNGGKTKEKR